MQTRLTAPLLALTLAIAATASAGPEGRPGGEERLARMQEHLGLSDEQVSQIREIRANGGGREEVHAVLTEEQIAMIREHRRKRHGGQRGAPEPE